MRNMPYVAASTSLAVITDSSMPWVPVILSPAAPSLRSNAESLGGRLPGEALLAARLTELVARVLHAQERL